MNEKISKLKMLRFIESSLFSANVSNRWANFKRILVEFIVIVL